jgi:oligoribonuclease NrnB/cAMP/cGMP phosphodiesterase (DHH superfamily)
MSAAIVKLKHPEVQLIGWDYGMPIPSLNPQQEDVIIMVDISFPKLTMDPINELFDLIWIDHHISAIKDMEDLNIVGLRDTKFSACELTWKYFFPKEDMPELVRLIGRYDCFGHKGTEEEQLVLEFQYGARDYITDPETAFIALNRSEKLSTLDYIYNNGKVIYKYLCTEAKEIYSRIFSVSFSGYKFACVNQVRFNPINFGIDYHKDGYDGFACFHFQHGSWMFSLYNDNGLVDCSLIAKSLGGGGHKGAAGFRIIDINIFLYETPKA